MPDPAAVNSMFARIADNYDRANHVLSVGVDLWWRRRLVQAVKRNAPRTILDLATGSGDVAFALSRALGPDTVILGADFCQPMLDEAELKKRDPGNLGKAAVRFIQADAMNLPMLNESFDAVTISFGLRNVADRARSLVEMRRILRPAGRLFILEFSQPYGWFKPLYYFYLRRVLPKIAGWVTGDRPAYVYLNETIEEFPAAEELAKEVRAAGFSTVHFRRLTLGIVALHEAHF